MNFDQETTTLLLDYFATNLHSAASRDLLTTVKEGNAEELWTCWTRKISSRVEHLAFDSIEDAFSWGELCACENEKSSCDVHVVLNFLRQFVRFHRNASDMPPLRWLEYVADSEEILKIVPEQVHPDEFPLLNQILLGEFRLMLGLLYPELIPFRSFAQSGKRQLIQGIESLVNGKGFPEFRNLFCLRELLACWTRSLLLATDAGQVLFPNSVLRRYEWVILQAMQWTRSDGTAVLSPIIEKNTKLEKERLRRFIDLIDAALHFDEDQNDSQIASVLLAPQVKKTGRIPFFSQHFTENKFDPNLLPDASCFGDELPFSIQRENWKPSSPIIYLAADPAEQINVANSPNNKINVDLYNKQILTEFQLAGMPVFSGLWNISLQINGKQPRPASPWQAVCCESNECYSYSEWEMHLAGDYRIERRCILVPDEKILLLGDTVRKKNSSQELKTQKIEYISNIQMNPKLTCTPSQDGGVFIHPNANNDSPSKPIAHIIPFFFENIAATQKTSQHYEDAVQTVFSKTGTALFAPLLIDYDPVRMKKPVIVRRLTVAKQGTSVPNDDALGFRVQLGKDQFIVYQTLNEKAVRTVLGLHLISDFVLGKFYKETGPQTIVGIESSDSPPSDLPLQS